MTFENFQEFIQKVESAQKDHLIPISIENKYDENIFFPNKFHNHLKVNRIMELLILAFMFGMYKNMRKGLKEIGNGPNNKTKNFELLKDLNIRFKDVAGMTRPKQELSEFVEFLKDGSKFEKLGAIMPKGALMTGPPGVGKTYLAKAIAGEAGVSFFFVSGSEFVEKYVGVGASRVREIFKQAKKKSPALIFIDEIDAVAQKRTGKGGHTEGMNTLNQLLVEMDGFETDQQVIVIGSTNFKEVLDPAILRPGRFDRLIEIGYPSLEEREEIFEIYLKKIVLNEEKNRGIQFYKQKLATLTPGFTGADISNIVNEVETIWIF